MTGWETIVAITAGSLLTIAEVLIRYANFRGQQFKSWVCWAYIGSNGFASVVVLAIVGATRTPDIQAEDFHLGGVQRAGAVVIAVVGALSILRAGTIATRIQSTSASPKRTESEGQTDHHAIEAVRSFLRFLVERSDVHVQRIYSEHLTDLAHEVCPAPPWSFSDQSGRLVTMCAQLGGLAGPVSDPARQARFLSDASTVGPQELDDGQKWLLLLRHCIHHTSVQATERALATLP